ncbi:protein of unknown function DUF1481 [Musicola paradisiaca Ech703]|uniref:DUF1481 domain-containing protein n=1 Tax=Musicola paradisiaca (strain Ech703) TaxID=579405 RepID=C6C4Q7_MUSP7|nr:protein of unknown function DUF1481 [Musicola paradisiaca Ech703]
MVIALATACSSHSPPPALYAGGYLADRGVVRLWRMDDEQQHTTTLMTVFSPLQGQDTQITRYQFQQGVLRDVQQRHGASASQDQVRLRFDQDGAVNFMQRQLPDRRESLSEDEIALYQFDARRMLEMSDVMRAGNVRLLQGVWQEGRVVACDGKVLKPALDGSSLAWIRQRQQNARAPVSIAWLVSNAGTQLLLVANADLCRWEPTAETL